MKTMTLISLLLWGLPISALSAEARLVPDKIIVLTFDDSVSSHAEFVAPYLKELGFGATFFITEGFDFKTDKTHYMSWAQIKTLADDGFEIGNHTQAHQAVPTQKREALKDAILHIDEQCRMHKITKPVSFCYPGYATSDAAVELLSELGFKYARAGGQRAFEPEKDNPLLIPQAFDGKPASTLEQFIKAAEMSNNGKISVMTFHGIPDIKHPWVSTDVDKFKSYMKYLKDNRYTVIAMKDMGKYLDLKSASNKRGSDVGK